MLTGRQSNTRTTQANSMATSILLLTGMTPDVRIFDRLTPLLPAASVVPWIDALPHESISDYAVRLADSIAIREDVIVCGVSFGGIIARELAMRLNAKACVLVSSVRDASQLPPWYRVFRAFAQFPVEPVLNALGTAAASCPKRIRTDATARCTKFAGDAGVWHRWATASVLRWNASCGLDKVPVIQIHGDRDTTFPIRYVDADIVIVGGGHLLPLTHAPDVAKILANLAA